MGLRKRFAELARGTPAPETHDDNDTSAFFSSSSQADINRRKPEDNALEKYWHLYKQEPLVRTPIRRFADDVTEPGYKIEAADTDLQEDLEDALEDCAIVSGESGHDFREVLHQSVIQREVRGTALVELVPREGQESDPTSMWGFRLINVSTVSGMTYPNKSVLVHPSDTDANVPTTPRGEAAAYVQFADDSLIGPFDDKDPVPLSQNDVVKITSDADTGDIWGTSRIEAVYHEVQGLRQIKRDNEEAIAAKAYPHWFIKVGNPNPDVNDAGRVAGLWPDDKMKDLRDKHTADNFEPGQKDVVPGDVEIDKIEGSTADLEYVINHYVEHILAAMPQPKYAVGFADQINRDVTGPQADEYNRLVERTRRDLEDAFQKALKRKAMDLGYSEDVAGTVNLRIEPRREASPLKDDSFNVNEFQSFMQGLATAAPDNDVTQIMSVAEIRERVLGLERQDELPDELRPVVDDPESDAAENAVESIEDSEETGTSEDTISTQGE